MAGFREILLNTDSILWVKDREQILVSNEERQEMLVLRGVEATVWGWLVLSYPYEKILRSLTIMLGVSTTEAEERLWKIFQKLIGAGYLNIESR